MYNFKLSGKIVIVVFIKKGKYIIKLKKNN